MKYRDFIEIVSRFHQHLGNLCELSEKFTRYTLGLILLRHFTDKM